MSMSDPIADLLTRIRNATAAHKATVDVRHSNEKEAIVKILSREGFVEKYQVKGDNKKDITVTLKYDKKRNPAFKELQRVSKPGRRVYLGKEDIKPVNNNMGIGIISTSQGVMTTVKAKNLGIGGEFLCKVF